MKPIRTIAAREFTQTLHSRAYLLTTLLGLLGLVVLSFLPTFTKWVEQRSITKVVVVDEVGGIQDEIFASYESIPENVRPYIQLELPPKDISTDSETMARQVREGKIRAYLRVSPALEEGKAEPSFTLVTKNAGGNLIRGIEQIVYPVATQRRLIDLQISAQQAAHLQMPVLSQVINVDASLDNTEQGDDGKQAFMSEVLAYLLLFMLYMTIIGYGSVLTNGVAAEKGSRIMEMMLVSVRPNQLLTGKILGLGAASLLQYIIWVAIGLSASWAGGLLKDLNIGGIPLELSSVPISTIGYFFLFYIIGYLAYAALFAAAGCLVSRPEESSQTIMPVMVLIIVAYFMAFNALNNPGGTIARVASLIPIFTPMAMFTRIVMSNVPISEIVLSIVLSVAFIWLTIEVGSRIYRFSILRTRRAGWLEGLRGR